MCLLVVGWPVQRAKIEDRGIRRFYYWLGHYLNHTYVVCFRRNGTGGRNEISHVRQLPRRRWELLVSLLIFLSFSDLFRTHAFRPQIFDSIKGFYSIFKERSLWVLVCYIPIDHLLDSLFHCVSRGAFTITLPQHFVEICCHGRNANNLAHGLQLFQVLVMLFLDTFADFLTNFKLFEEWLDYILLHVLHFESQLFLPLMRWILEFLQFIFQLIIFREQSGTLCMKSLIVGKKLRWGAAIERECDVFLYCFDFIILLAYLEF